MKWFFSLKTKIILSFTSLILLLGGVTISLVYSQLSDNVRDALVRKGEGMARAMAESCRHLILTENTVRLQEIIDSLKADDKEISYIYITDRYNMPQAHTFDKTIPADLLNLKSASYPDKFRHFYLDMGDDHIRHITAPLDQGKVGFVSIGLTEQYRREWIAVMLKKLLSIAILCLTAGIIGMYILSSIITASIGKLVKTAGQVGRGEFNVKVDITTRDEMNELGQAFNKMSDDLKEYTRRLNESENNLSRAKQMSAIGQMCAALAHEINNPLDGIQRSLNIIKRPSPDAALNEKLFGLITDGLKRIEHTVHQVLVYARYQPDFGLADINTIIEKTFQLMEPRMKENKIEAKLQLDKSIPVFRADPNGLAQVVSNLLLNALDMLGPGGRISVITKLSDSDKSRAEIRFSDNGPGIPPEISDKIFEAFFSTKEASKGTGLGLSITRNIIEQHYGTIQLEPGSGKGAHFLILLPISDYVKDKPEQKEQIK